MGMLPSFTPLLHKRSKGGARLQTVGLYMVGTETHAQPSGDIVAPVVEIERLGGIHARGGHHLAVDGLVGLGHTQLVGEELAIETIAGGMAESLYLAHAGLPQGVVDVAQHIDFILLAQTDDALQPLRGQLAGQETKHMEELVARDAAPAKPVHLADHIIHGAHTVDELILQPLDAVVIEELFPPRDVQVHKRATHDGGMKIDHHAAIIEDQIAYHARLLLTENILWLNDNRDNWRHPVTEPAHPVHSIVPVVVKLQYPLYHHPGSRKPDWPMK